jgi:hypothetical protein
LHFGLYRLTYIMYMTNLIEKSWLFFLNLPFSQRQFNIMVMSMGFRIRADGFMFCCVTSSKLNILTTKFSHL